MRESAVGDPPGVSAAELMAHAKRQGFAVTAYQIERWYKQDVLPRPVRRALGRGRGTESRYPLVSLRQLVSLRELLARHRSLARARWWLWWQRYPVPMARVR